jgi:hypothetical protein
MNVFERIDQVGSTATERKEPPAAATKDKPVAATPFYEPADKKGEEKKTDQPGTTTQATTTPLLLDKARAEKSGKAKAYLASSGLETLFSAIEMIRYHYAMTHEEKMMLIASRQKDKEQWTEQERAVNLKHAFVKDKHDEIVKKIPFDEKTMEILEYGYTLHTQVTGKESDPMLIIYGMFARVLGNQLMNMFIV